ncbi:MAG: primosomal protein N' [Patescibacteria group bacterium]
MTLLYQNVKIKVMYILNVIPLIKIPRPNSQLLSYFSSEKTEIGSLVEILIRNRKLKAIVVEQKNIEKEKLKIKKQLSFSIRPINKIVSKEPILTKQQIELLFWISDYYFISLGQTARIFLSKNKEREKNFKKVKNNLILKLENKNIVFSPFKDLKSITIENEESELYKSWARRPYYNVKTIAIQLAKIHKAKLILKSKIPSIQTLYKYKPIIEKQAKNKKTKLIDMRQEMKQGNYSIISKELEERIKKYKKAILYITRRGTSTFVLCRECGYTANCKNCDAPMVFHESLRKTNKSLLCHHCSKQDIAPVLCPKCRSIKIKYFGSGTEKVESELKKIFPNVLRMDGDISEKPEQQEKIIKEFKKTNSILIGTQMILNKDIKADLTGIISIDTLLNLPDYHNSEKIFQIINKLKQMSNKEFVLQTYSPENNTIQNAIANNIKTFYNQEIKTRKLFSYPPFSQIIKLSFEHKNPIIAKDQVKILLEKLKQQKKNLNLNLEIIGPIPGFISKVRNQYKWNILIKSKEKIEKRNKLLIIVPSNWEIQVDPETIL